MTLVEAEICGAESSVSSDCLEAHVVDEVVRVCGAVLDNVDLRGDVGGQVQGGGAVAGVLHGEPAGTIDRDVEIHGISKIRDLLGAVGKLVASVADTLSGGQIAGAISIALVHGFAAISNNGASVVGSLVANKLLRVDVVSEEGEGR